MVFCILKTLVRLTAVIILGTNVFKEQLGPIFSYKFYFLKLLKYVDINALAQVHSSKKKSFAEKYLLTSFYHQSNVKNVKAVVPGSIVHSTPSIFLIQPAELQTLFPQCNITLFQPFEPSSIFFPANTLPIMYCLQKWF